MKTIALFLLVPLTVWAAEPAAKPVPGVATIDAKVYQTVELALGAGSQRWAPALSFNAFYGFGRDQKIHMGFGLRASAFSSASDNLAYTTSDATLLEQGKIHTLTMAGAQTFALNMVLHIKYEVAPKWTLGMNLDVIGVGFGGPRVGSYGRTDPSFSTTQQASPSGFNLFFGGSRSRGQLMMEIFAAFEFIERWEVRAGYATLSSEFTADRPLDNGGKRFRLTNSLASVALSYRI